MSIQERNLRAIADAIREKDGTADPIPASGFAARIRALGGGGNAGDGSGITVLDDGAGDLAKMTPCIQLPELSAVNCTIEVQILEGYA